MGIEFIEKCAEVLFAEGVRHKALYGGRGGGKSWSVATYLIAKAVAAPLRIVCARQFQSSIRDSSKELIEKRIRDLGFADEFDITERSIRHANGSVFVFVGLERNPDSFRSHEGADIVWIEEARTISARSLEILLPTVRAFGAELIWTWNPEQPDDPVDYFFRGPHPPADAAIAKVTYLDNKFFDQTSLPAEMNRLKEGNFERFKHVYLGEYDIRYTSKVFTNVRTGRIDIPPNCRSYVGMDFGFSTDPTALALIYVLLETRQIYIAREVYAHRVSLDQLPELIASIVHDPGDLIRADSSQPQTIDYLQSRGYGVVPARKGPGSIKSGIAFLQGFEIVIDPSCENARDEFRLYSWPTDKITGVVVPGVNPVDTNNHIVDCVRYACEDVLESATIAEDDPDGGVLMLNLWKQTPEFIHYRRE